MEKQAKIGPAVLAVPQATAAVANEPRIDPAILDRVYALNFRIVCELLDIGPRQLRNLMAAGKLERVGEGHRRMVTSESVRWYGGFPKKSGNKWKSMATNGSLKPSLAE